MARRLPFTTALTVTALLAVTTTAGAATGFLEPDVVLIDTLVGEEASGQYGWVAANIGDVDADGVDDLAVPEISNSTGGPEAGTVTVYSGATRAVLAEHVGDPGDNLGHSTAPAGDVDGDGVPDYVAGGPGASPASPGHVVVWSGADHAVVLDLAGPGGFWGFSVSGAGDVDGDGHDDILVGAPLAAGGAGTLSVLSGTDGAQLWSITGATTADRLGSAVGLVGDVDGDGTPDSVVGAFRASKGGTAYVVSGVDGRTIHRLNPTGQATLFGIYFASGAGDVDGDGVGDVFVADYASGRPMKPNQRNTPKTPIGSGAAYVFSGATGERIHRFVAESPGDGFGPGRGVGDVDGDGYADLIIAGYTSSAGAPGAGRATVFSGRTREVLQVITSTTANENFGVDALGLGDVDGDGRTDFVVTAVGLSFAGVAPGTAYVVAGTTP